MSQKEQQKGKGDSYYTTPYNLKPRVRELLAKKLGNKGLSFMKAENIVESVMKGKYSKTLTTFTEEDKKKLMGMLQNSFSTNIPKENVEIIVKFLQDNFTEDEIKVYLDSVLEKYKPGMVYQGVRISNHTIIYFLEALKIYPLMKGIVINKKSINDLIPFFDKDAEEFDFDPETLLVENDFTHDMLEIFEGISIDTDMRYHNDDDIFVLGTFDDDIAGNMVDSFKGLEVQSIPVHMFKWEREVNIGDFTSGFDVTPKEELTGGDFTDRQLNFTKDSNTELLSKLNNPKYVEYKDTIEKILEKRKADVPETEVGDATTPPNTPETPFSTEFKSSEPTDVLFNGAGYGSGIEFMDDFYSVTIKMNGNTHNDYFETDGGLCIGKLHTPLMLTDIDEDNVEDCGVDFMILRNFVGEINLTIKVDALDDNDNPETFYEKLSELDDDIYYAAKAKYEKMGYGDVSVYIYYDVVGTFDKEEKLTKEIFNSLNHVKK